MSNYELRITQGETHHNKLYSRQADVYADAMAEVKSKRNQGLKMLVPRAWKEGPRVFRRWEAMGADGQVHIVEIFDVR